VWSVRRDSTVVIVSITSKVFRVEVGVNTGSILISSAPLHTYVYVCKGWAIKSGPVPAPRPSMIYVYISMYQIVSSLYVLRICKIVTEENDLGEGVLDIGLNHDLIACNSVIHLLRPISRPCGFLPTDFVNWWKCKEGASKVGALVDATDVSKAYIT
jgi:hypothetical protein